MALSFRSEGVIVAWTNTMGVPRRVGDIVVDNGLVGIALDDICPMGQEIWRLDRKPITPHGAVIRCGIHAVKIHLTDNVLAWQQAYYNRTLDVVSNDPGSMASLPQPAQGNAGRTVISNITVGDTATTEEWYLDFLYQGDNGSVWKLAGSLSGTLADDITAGVYWMDEARRIGFLITDADPSRLPAPGDRFTWYTMSARTKFGIFANDYPASATSGEILLDECKTVFKRVLHGKYYR
jgi:hypothetical protein